MDTAVKGRYVHGKPQFPASAPVFAFRSVKDWRHRVKVKMYPINAKVDHETFELTKMNENIEFVA